MVILKKWHPKFILSKDSYSKILVWVKLFNTPHEYWNEEGLSHIASAVGKPLYADSLTKSMKRISFARVCIEIDASCDLVDSFDLFMGDNSDPNLVKMWKSWLNTNGNRKSVQNASLLATLLRLALSSSPYTLPLMLILLPSSNKNGG
ncbi:hypothetical protein LWI28_025225 [Acer negundo]|uniref:DUF4283 domain-containing protein n=1 Tax=Acer negundo TaxID=4023 RepID=A0AAD5P335_ACENE|nr:hypothetical protein LWI28_025225 [Acer negundo]